MGWSLNRTTVRGIPISLEQVDLAMLKHIGQKWWTRPCSEEDWWPGWTWFSDLLPGPPRKWSHGISMPPPGQGEPLAKSSQAMLSRKGTAKKDSKTTIAVKWRYCAWPIFIALKILQGLQSLFVLITLNTIKARFSIVKCFYLYDYVVWPSKYSLTI